MSVTLVGHSCIDQVRLADGSLHRRTGGVPFYAGQTFAELGRPCRIVTKYNPEDDLITSALGRSGADITILPASQSTSFGFDEAGGQVGEPSLVAAAEPINGSELDWNSGDAVYFAPLTPHDITTDCYQAARNTGKLIFLDAQGLTRHEASEANRAFAHAMLSLADVVKVTSAEALWLFGNDDPAELQSSLGELGVTEAALTRGEQGSVILSPNGIGIVDAEVVDASDKVGCGDIYFAAYIDARLSGHQPASAGAIASGVVTSRLKQTAKAMMQV
jgi:sugar/nucleoside kinase (ribokinase family)